MPADILVTKSFPRLFIQCCLISLVCVSVCFGCQGVKGRGRNTYFWHFKFSGCIVLFFMKSGHLLWSMHSKRVSKKLKFSFNITCSIFLHKDKYSFLPSKIHNQNCGNAGGRPALWQDSSHPPWMCSGLCGVAVRLGTDVEKWQGSGNAQVSQQSHLESTIAINLQFWCSLWLSL